MTLEILRRLVNPVHVVVPGCHCTWVWRLPVPNYHAGVAQMCACCLLRLCGVVLVLQAAQHAQCSSATSAPAVLVDCCQRPRVAVCLEQALQERLAAGVADQRVVDVCATTHPDKWCWATSPRRAGAHKEVPVRTSAALQRIWRRQLVRWLRRCCCSEPWQRAPCSSDKQPAQRQLGLQSH